MKERTQVCARATSLPHPESNVVAEAACRGVMERLKKALDPTQIGPEAGKLAAGLHQRIVGQDEAIHAIVSAYQMYLAGTNSPGRPIVNFLFWARPVRVRPGWWKLPPRAWLAMPAP